MQGIIGYKQDLKVDQGWQEEKDHEWQKEMITDATDEKDGHGLYLKFLLFL